MKLYGDQQDSGAHEARENSPAEETPEIEVTEVRSEDTGFSPPPEAEPKKKKGPRKALTVAGVIAAVLLAAGIGYSVWERPPEINTGNVTEPPASTVSVTAAPKPEATGAPEESAEPEETEAPEEEDPGEAPVILSSPMHNSPRKEGVYTILLVGVDKVSDSTDTIMVVNFDTVNHKLTGTSIPRDTLINIGFISPKKINTVFPAYGGGEKGIEGLKGEIRNVLGFEVDNYVVVYLQAVEDVVDAIGGVEYDVPFDMIYEDFVQDLWIEIYAGRQVLDGHNALNFCRFRNGYPGGDLQRIEVQHDFLTEMAAQVIKKGITNIPGLVKVLLDDVDTDLSAANLAWFARQFLKCSKDDILLQTAPIGGGDLINGVSFVGLDVYGWLDMINESINPYEDDVTIGDVNILTFGYGGFVGSTVGYIAGGYDSFYCMQCTINAGGQTRYHGPNGEHFTFGEEAVPEEPAPEEVPQEEPYTEPYAENPAEGYSDAPAEGYTDTPAEGYTDAPAEGYTDAPAEGYSEAPPAEEYTDPQPAEPYAEPYTDPAPAEQPVTEGYEAYTEG